LTHRPNVGAQGPPQIPFSVALQVALALTGTAPQGQEEGLEEEAQGQQVTKTFQQLESFKESFTLTVEVQG
jgi:hypothetical protein